MHIETRIEELKKLKERVKILKDFQATCRKRVGQALSQKKDARVQLISVPKLSANVQVSALKTISLRLSSIHFLLSQHENCFFIGTLLVFQVLKSMLPFAQIF